MSQEITITPEADKVLAEISPEIKLILGKANSISVKDDTSDADAITFLGDLKDEIKRVDAMRKELVDPLKSTVKKIDNAFKIRIEPMEKADEIVRSKVKTYRDEKQRIANEEAERIRKQREQEAREAEEKAKEALAKAERAKTDKGREAALAQAQKAQEQAELASTPLAFESPETSLRTENAMSSMKKIWKFEITNQLEVPAEFLIVDEKKVNQAIRSGTREIKGIRIYQDTTLSIR